MADNVSDESLTISTTSTSASIRRWYRNVMRSFFIWILLSSIWATVKMRILHFLHTFETKREQSRTKCSHCSFFTLCVFLNSCWSFTERFLNQMKSPQAEKFSLSLVSHLVLAQQEGEEHQHASVVDNPPHVDVALGESLSVGRVAGDVLRNQQGQTGYSCLSDHLWNQTQQLICGKSIWETRLTHLTPFV